MRIHASRTASVVRAVVAVALVALVVMGAPREGAVAAVAGSTVTHGVATATAAPSSARINEVESQGGDPGDWVELTGVGPGAVDVGGLVLTDDDPTHRFTIPAGTVVAPGVFAVLDQAGDGTPGFDFGLGSPDGVRLLARDGRTVIDQVDWTRHAPTTLGRRPDGTGDPVDTARATKGWANAFADPLATEPWPGAPTLTTVDDRDLVTGDLSGLDIEPSGSSAPGVLWGVADGGTLFRLVQRADGTRASDPSAAWSGGRTLRFPDGTGTVDAEGVSVADDSSVGGVYVAAERDSDRPAVARPSVLRYDVSGSATTLSASDEWDLGDDLSGVGANSGPEGITWIPDAALTAGGFVDGRTGRAYVPADHPGHGDGLFLVGVEGTASVLAYALLPGGAHELLGTIATPFAAVADVQFDGDTDELRVVCDDACAGRTALYALDGSGAFVRERVQEAPADADPALEDEGFAIDAVATCVDGARATFYADDADTDGHSLRRGSYPCEEHPDAMPPDASDAASPAGRSTRLAVTGGGASGGSAIAAALLLALGASIVRTVPVRRPPRSRDRRGRRGHRPAGAMRRRVTPCDRT